MTIFKDLEKKTGVRFDFKHPPVGQEKEQFNLMMASNDLTDLIFWTWWDVPGGPGNFIRGGQIVALNDLINKYGPNFKKEMEKHPDYRKQVTLDDGTYYMIPKFKHELYTRISHGYQVREDWLERLGIKPPKTLDEWYQMLTAFKTKDANGDGDPNDEIPFGGYDTGHYSLRRFAYTFGVWVDFYLDNGKVRYGPIQPAYKDYLSTMRKWYAEGLIDPDYVSIDRKGFEAKVVGDKMGSYAGLMNGHMGKFLGLKKDDPNFKLMGLQPPIGPAGKPYGPMNTAATGDGVAVSSTCKDKPAAVRWGDYLFTEDGIRMINFGREGLTYTMKDGKPTFTELITNNPDGLPMIKALCRHNWAAHAGPGYQLESTFRQIQEQATGAGAAERGPPVPVHNRHFAAYAAGLSNSRRGRDRGDHHERHSDLRG
jgi:putative aldouronate transport system substrate-binding protein